MRLKGLDARVETAPCSPLRTVLPASPWVYLNHIVTVALSQAKGRIDPLAAFCHSFLAHHGLSTVNPERPFGKYMYTVLSPLVAFIPFPLNLQILVIIVAVILVCT